jgi:hypothetical protein
MEPDDANEHSDEARANCDDGERYDDGQGLICEEPCDHRDSPEEARHEPGLHDTGRYLDLFLEHDMLHEQVEERVERGAK